MTNKSHVALKIISGIIIVLLLIAFILMMFRGCGQQTQPQPDTQANGGVQWSGDQYPELPSNDQKTGYVSGFSALTFAADTTAQQVFFENSAKNTNVVTMTLLLSDGTTLWREQNIKPGQSFTDITISKSLTVGKYQAKLLYEFYDDNGNVLNGCSIPFILQVE